MPLAAGAAFLGALRHGGSSVAGDMHLSAVSVLALLGLAVLSTALPYPIFFHILAKAGATNALLVTLLMPVSAMALGAAFLGDRFGWTTYLGMGIIFAALAVIDGRAIAWLARLWQTSQASEPRELA